MVPCAGCEVGETDATKVVEAGRCAMLEAHSGGAAQTEGKMVEYIQRQEPTQRSLDTMLERVHSFRVIERGVSGGRPLGKKILLEGSDEKILTELRHFLQIVGPQDMCFCDGHLALEFLDESGNRLAAISVQHRSAIRWSEWTRDATLADAFGLLKWLAANGVEFPLFRNLKETDSQREEGKKVATAVLDGRIAVREALPKLFALASTDAIAEEQDKGLVVAFESEIKDFPAGDVRELWAPYALAEKDAEAARIEERWKKGFLEVCKKIAEA
jgi:hypothetical protein